MRPSASTINTASTIASITNSSTATTLPRDRGTISAWLGAEKITGATLGSLLATGSIKLADTVALASGLLDALERVHAARFVHRDVKPDNVVCTASGRSVLLDLGLARKLPSDPHDP